MPRKYIRKTDRGTKYSQETLLEAVRAVKNGTISAYAASKAYGIPRATIVNRVYDRKGLKSNTLGRATVLSRDIEEKLVKNLHTMEKYGFGLTRKELLETVGEYVAHNNIKTPFRDGVPGEDWFISFKKRHDLSVKKPQPVEYARKKACSPAVIYPYFDLLEKTLDDLGLRDKPSHIWNVDETSFSKDPSKSKVVGLRGYTSTRTISSPGKDNTTVLLGCNAFGEKAPPLIVFKGKNVWDQWTSEEGFPGTVYAATANGWMETAVFENFFEKVFLPTVGQKRPILLIYDGHSTHVGINIIEKARENDITILKIPPHTSDHLQPLDLAVNKSFKDKWDVALVKWQRLNIGKVLPKNIFSKIIGQVWTQIDPQVCAAGFRKAGIYPLNKNAVPENKFDQVLLTEWKRECQRSSILATELQPNQLKASENITSIVNLPQHDVSENILCLATSRKNNNNEAQINIDSYSQHIEAKVTITNNSKMSSNKLELLQNVALAKVNTIMNEPHDTVKVLQKTKSLEKQPGNGIVDKHFILTPTCNPIHVSLDDCVPLSSDQVLNLQDHIKREPLFRKQLNINDDKIQHSKVQILDNQPVTSNITFEQLLLKSIKPGISIKMKRKKIATGAEVITHDEVYKRCKIIEAEKEQKLKKHEDKQAKSKSKVTQKQNKRKKVTKEKKRREISTSSSENEADIIYDDESDVEYSQYCEELLLENAKENDVENEEPKEVSSISTSSLYEVEIDETKALLLENDWLIVQFSAKKSLKHYVGVVLHINGDGVPLVKFSRTKSKTAGETIFSFPVIDDISEVKDKEDIVRKLPTPEIGRRGQIIFKMSFRTFNIQ